jgi:chromosome segregation ATPase
MMILLQIFVIFGVGLVGYAVYGIFTTGKSEKLVPSLKKSAPELAQEINKDQKIQNLQSKLAKLESQLAQAQAAPVEDISGEQAALAKEQEFSVELKRRQEWVAKAEAELAKEKAENLELNNKFISRENELQEEFAKNVNLDRQARELKSALEAKEIACRLKEDQVQAQKQQIESQLKNIQEQAALIAEFKHKEKISEWIPKQEFNQLNEEYTKLEKELEEAQERLKSFAAEIAHLRLAAEKAIPLTEEIKIVETPVLPETLPIEEPKTVEEKVEEKVDLPQEPSAQEEKGKEGE